MDSYKVKICYLKLQPKTFQFKMLGLTITNAMQANTKEGVA